MRSLFRFGPVPCGQSGGASRAVPARRTTAIATDLFEGLATRAPDGSIIPGAAESWKVSDHGLTYDFHLRAGFRWSNGDALTSEHFAEGLGRVIADGSTAPNASLLADLWRGALGYASAAYDELLAQTILTADPRDRMELLRQAEERLLVDMPVIPVFLRVSKRLVKPCVTGAGANPLGHLPSRDLGIEHEQENGREARATRPKWTRRSGGS